VTSLSAPTSMLVVNLFEIEKHGTLLKGDGAAVAAGQK
jgi:hypothetical protein